MIVPRAVPDAVRFLESHPDYAACAGRQFSVTVGPEAAVVALRETRSSESSRTLTHFPSETMVTSILIVYLR